MKQNRASAHQEALLIMQSGAAYNEDNIANKIDGKVILPIELLIKKYSHHHHHRQQHSTRFSVPNTTFKMFIQIPFISFVCLLLVANVTFAADNIANNELITFMGVGADISTSTEFGNHSI